MESVFWIQQGCSTYKLRVIVPAYMEGLYKLKTDKISDRRREASRAPLAEELLATDGE